MKVRIKWSALNDSQRKQVLSFHEEQIQKKELFEHNLNQGTYTVNVRTGNVIHHKDF